VEAAPYYLMAAVHLGVLVGFVTLAVRDRSFFTVLVCLVSAGLTFDNVMLAVGEQLGDGDALRVLSKPRFWVHGLLTPTLMVIALSWARAMGVGWARKRGAWLGIGGLTVAVMLYGLWFDVLHLDLELKDEHGILRYTYTEPTHSLPGPVITVVVLLVIGVALWRSVRWPWLLAGSAFMFIASGGGAGVPYVANVGETVLAVTLLLTAREAQRVTQESPAPAVPSGAR
jgi:hypothetical protein